MAVDITPQVLFSLMKVLNPLPAAIQETVLAKGYNATLCISHGNGRDIQNVTVMSQ